MTRRSLAALPTSAGAASNPELYAPQADAQPWSYLVSTSPSRLEPSLTITAWTHHGTAWATATGALTDHTAATLQRFLERLRSAAPRGTVLNLCQLTDLDVAGVRIIIAEHHLVNITGRRFDVVTPWAAPAPSVDNGIQ